MEQLQQTGQQNTRRTMMQQAAAEKSTSTSPVSEIKEKPSRKRVRIETVVEDEPSESGEKVSPVDPVFEDYDVPIANRTTVIQPKKRITHTAKCRMSGLMCSGDCEQTSTKKVSSVKRHRPVSRNTHCGKCGDPLRPLTGGCTDDHCILVDEEGGLIVDPKGSTAKRGY